MKRADYSDEHWDRVVDRNKQKGWSLPPADSEALQLLEAAGYKDLVQESHESKPGGTLWTSPGEPPVRIDYVYASPAFSWAARAHVDSAAAGSDHYPVVVDVFFD
eukprot:TRINITY_DN38108_c0_g1_i2.p3 TRINITY_DN38108_c0_g1~~TRINITY_DN38108_c0_g1_i2.p3  ORF type:complete len:105 (+),score=14.52 TRINITY_DN38108_c0_g1_i2:939-1253(+)